MRTKYREANYLSLLGDLRCLSLSWLSLRRGRLLFLSLDREELPELEDEESESDESLFESESESEESDESLSEFESDELGDPDRLL